MSIEEMMIVMTIWSLIAVLWFSLPLRVILIIKRSIIHYSNVAKSTFRWSRNNFNSRIRKK